MAFQGHNLRSITPPPFYTSDEYMSPVPPMATGAPIFAPSAQAFAAPPPSAPPPAQAYAVPPPSAQAYAVPPPPAQAYAAPPMTSPMYTTMPHDVEQPMTTPSAAHPLVHSKEKGWSFINIILTLLLLCCFFTAFVKFLEGKMSYALMTIISFFILIYIYKMYNDDEEPKHH